PGRGLVVSIRLHGARVPIDALRAPQGCAIGQADQQTLDGTLLGLLRRWTARGTPGEREALGRRSRSADDASCASAITAYQTAALIGGARPHLGVRLRGGEDEEPRRRKQNAQYRRKGYSPTPRALSANARPIIDHEDGSNRSQGRLVLFAASL